MSDCQDYLFNQTNAFSLQADRRDSLQKEIAAYDADKLLNSNVNDLVKYFVKEFEFEIPVLLENEMTADQKEARRDVSGDPRRIAYHLNHGPVHVTGTEITIEVPFTGDARIFHIKPNTYNSVPPNGTITNNTLIFKVWGDDMQPAGVRAALQAWIAHVRQYLQWLSASFASFNGSLDREALQAIEARRLKLLRNQNLVAGIGVPLRRRSGLITTYTAPEVKRRIAPKLPPATPGNFKPEPLLEEAEYQHILSILESMSKTMERDPRAFYNLDEESLRSMFLVPLNGHYEGNATGETFNHNGKTDILIRSGDRNIFIAECTFWGGSAKMIETVNQLLGYLSWRDSKAAIIIFNRNKNFSRVLETIPGVMAAHPNFQKDEGRQSETRFRYALHHRDDTAKILHVTVMVFDVRHSTERH